ncbi:MAG TPA: transcriptional repressor [Patescibacteria group bacterium]|nr:transcriptional repressor [Patescibacteria group bacterium]
MIKTKLQKLLAKSKSPISVPEILEEIDANKTTIYRELTSFIKDGLITEIEFGDGKKRYEWKDHGHHHHLICKTCGKIEDVKVDEKKLIKSITNKNFLIESHSLEFFGKCKNCITK